MAKFSFRALNKADAHGILPEMFRILYTNMTQISPTGCTYREDEVVWSSYMMEQLNRDSLAVILMYADDTLVGYFQYRVCGEILNVDEIEIAPEYQRTLLFYRLCRYLFEHLPGSICTVESYVNKQNGNSLRLHQKLGLRIAGENPSGSSWRFRGDLSALKKYMS